MAFKIQGEVLIDDKRGTPVLKNLQREATKTSRSFDNAEPMIVVAIKLVY